MISAGQHRELCSSIEQLAIPRVPRKFVYIAYLDDSGSTGRNLKDRQSSFQVVTAVIIQDVVFTDVEVGSALLIESFIPEEKRPTFEFHANELFYGQGMFKSLGVEESREAFARMLEMTVKNAELPIVYGAVDKLKLGKSLLKSAIPIDAAFRGCAEGVESWMQEHAEHELAILIADDTKNEVDKQSIKEAFRDLREKMTIVHTDEPAPLYIGDSREPAGKILRFKTGLMGHILDDMYFGDSRDSIGIQVADMCGFLIHRKLSGKQDSEYLYQMIAPHIIPSSRIVPE